MLQILEGQIDIGSSTIFGRSDTFFESSSVLDRVEYVFISKAPEPTTTIGNLTKPFSVILWLTIFVTLASICCGIFISYMTYFSLEIGLAKQEHAHFNLVLFPCFKVTEPEPLPWFSRGTGGHLFVFSWTLFAWFMVMCYQTNLRAHLISQEYDKPVDTLNDVLTRTTKIWIGEVTAAAFL